MQEITNREEMFALIKRWKESGKTQKQFSRENGIKYSKFLYWMKKYRQSSLSQNNDFLPLEVIASGGSKNSIESTTQPKVEVEFSSGITLRIY